MCTLRPDSTCEIGEGSSDRVGVCGDSCWRMNWTAAEIPGLLMTTEVWSSTGSDFVDTCGDNEGDGGEGAGVN